MDRVRGDRWRWPLKALLIGAYLAFDHQAIALRMASLGLSAAVLIYLALFALLTGVLLATAAIRSDPIRMSLALLLCAGSAFLQSVEWTTGGPLTYEVFINLYQARGNAGDALAQHGAILLSLVAPALCLFAGLAIRPGRLALPTRIGLAPPLLAVLLLSLICYQRGGEGTSALPPPFTPLAYVAVMGFEAAIEEHGPRRDVAIARAGKRLDRDLILIVDESVAGNYLDINDPAGVPTPLAAPPPGVSVVNYGEAVSIHNCSATSNLALRYGGTRDNYRETIAHYPSIWRYAARAGLRPVYIDAQATGGELQNLMTEAERAEIADFVQFDKVPVLDRDMAVADEIARRIANGRPEFIYVNKVGAHFPVADKFPLALERYRPVLARGAPQDGLSWTSDRTGFHGRPDEWLRYRNSYRNVLLWNVGAFFERLFRSADLERATIIYTSDHGQDLHERGNPGNNTHCGTHNPVLEEGVVPLLVLDAAGRASLPWQASLAANRNGMSHYRIFPTLLALMGYRPDAVRATYGASLVEPDKDAFSMNLMFNALLGREPDWQHIDLAKVVSPPPADYAPAAPARSQLAALH